MADEYYQKLYNAEASSNEAEAGKGNQFAA